MIRPRSAPVAGMCAVVFLASALIGIVTVAQPAAGRSAEDVHMLGTDREPGGAPRSYVGVGLSGGFKFFDGDLPPDLRRIAVRISSTSDPNGMPVWANRDARASAYYYGTFSFSTTATNAPAATIRVSPGDEVTMTYLDASDDSGTPAVVQVRAPWYPGSAQPDEREVSFSNADPQSPVVWGAWRAVAPLAAVRVYTGSSSAAPIATGAARADGSFSITTPAMSNPPAELWLAAVEPGQPESVRVRVGWSAVTGRVVLPEPGSPPVLSSFAHARKAGCTGDVGCGGAGMTDHHGRWDVDPTRNNWPGTGDYDLTIRRQGIQNAAVPPPWRSSAYGNPPSRRVTVSSASTTADVGDVPLLPPNVHGRVHGGPFAVPEAQLWLLSPSGENLGGGGYTRDDGRFALHLLDGDYVLWVRPPVGCGGYRDPRITIQVRGGVANPATIDVDVAIGSQPVPASSVPLAGGGGAPSAVTVLAPTGEVSVALDGAGGSGWINAGCASLGPRPDLDLAAPPVDLAAPGLSFTSAEVCLSYDPEALAARGVEPTQLELYHLNQDGSAAAVTTARDLPGHRVCGMTTSFSPFALARPTGAPAPIQATTTTATAPTSTTAPPPSSPPPSSTPTTAAPRTPTPTPAPPSARSGYRMVTTTGSVSAFGDTVSLGNATLGPSAAVDIENTPSGNGYWITDGVGQVFAFGDAAYLGGGPQLAAGETVTSLSVTATGRGYWLFTTAGRALPFGDAPFLGDMRGTRLNGPVLDSIPTRSGRGYFMVASDGGIFTFGDARFEGSMGGHQLNAPVQSLVPDPDGTGYWLVASDGGIFAFAADFYGSMGAVRLNRPVSGMVGFSRGYLMVAEDGGIFSFGDASFHGSLGANPPPHPVIAVAPIS